MKLIANYIHFLMKYLVVYVYVSFVQFLLQVQARILNSGSLIIFLLYKSKLKCYHLWTFVSDRWTNWSLLNFKAYYIHGSCQIKCVVSLLIILNSCYHSFVCYVSYMGLGIAKWISAQLLLKSHFMLVMIEIRCVRICTLMI